MRKIINRVYSDYLMPSRLDEYEKIIEGLLKKGYTSITVKEYKKLLDNNDIKGKKLFINRHDIDTDIKTAKEFFKIEKKYGIKTTYYFRLSTLNIEFMKDIEALGGEASYHFEEIAKYAKDNHIKSKKDILSKMEDIKTVFKKNFTNIEKELGYKLKSVCSHGDFVNRYLQIINNEITKDKELRKELGIICEAYDDDILRSIDIYISDGKFSIKTNSKDILNMANGSNIIYILTHPRQWKSSFFCNTKENIKRVIESIKW